MGDMRRDYVSNKICIIARPPSAGSAPPPGAGPASSPLAPGNESRTGPSQLSLVVRDGMLQRLRDDDDEFVQDWAVRAFASMSPVVTADADNTYSDRPNYSEPAYGHHLTIAAVPRPSDSIAGVDIDQWSNILIAVQDCILWLYSQKGVSYVALYMDHKPEAGSADPYPHAEIMSLPTLPPVIDAEIRAYQRIANESGTCAVCDMLEPDAVGSRGILKTSLFEAFCPWAPSHEYEFWICPTKHMTSFASMTQKEVNDLALMIRSTLGGLSKALKDPAYSIVFHLSPERKVSRQVHWHIEVCPVTRPQDGMARGYGVHVNRVPPEAAASVLGAACRREMALLVGIT